MPLDSEGLSAVGLEKWSGQIERDLAAYHPWPPVAAEVKETEGRCFAVALLG
jgi:hypothetical protein